MDAASLSQCGLLGDNNEGSERIGVCDHPLVPYAMFIVDKNFGYGYLNCTMTKVVDKFHPCRHETWEFNTHDLPIEFIPPRLPTVVESDEEDGDEEESGEEDGDEEESGEEEARGAATIASVHAAVVITTKDGELLGGFLRPTGTVDKACGVGRQMVQRGLKKKSGQVGSTIFYAREGNEDDPIGLTKRGRELLHCDELGNTLKSENSE